MLSLPAHVVPVAIAAALAVSLSGCVPTPASREPTVSPPRPTATPLFASDEEALAAAEEAYAAYLAIASVISADGGREPERITPFVTEEYLAEEIESSRRLEATALRIVGEPEVATFTLQYFSYPELSAYACQEISQVRVLDGAGTDVTPADRPDEGLFEVRFEFDESSALVAGSSLWSDEC